MKKKEETRKRVKMRPKKGKMKERMKKSMKTRKGKRNRFFMIIFIRVFHELCLIKCAFFGTKRLWWPPNFGTP